MPVPAFPSLNALHAAYADGLSPEAVLAETYRRIAAADDPGIFLALVPEEEAAAAARALGPFDPETKPLWGVPFAVKDNIDVAGLPTTAACPDFAYTPDVTAPAVERLLAAGALLVGKTNLDQFATGLVGVRTPYPVPKNAFDPEIVPGGSSSGSAVAVARGLVGFALGTDTAGSGRVPAGLNNVVGLKPSLGSVSGRGVVPACRTLDTLSVFAGTVAEADAVYRVIAGYDAQDAYARPLPVPPRPGSLPPGLRVGVPDAASRIFGGDALSEAAFDAALADLRTVLGGEAVAIDLAPFFAVAQLLYAGPWVAERYQAIRGFIEARSESLHPTTRAIIGAAASHSAADAFAGLYRLAEMRRATEPVWRGIDVLVVPTYPRPHRVADLAADPVGPNSELGTYTNFVNLLDLCALAVPGRPRADGFPSGVTLIAPRGADGLLAELGARLHAASGGTLGASGVPIPAEVARHGDRAFERRPERRSPAFGRRRCKIKRIEHRAGSGIQHDALGDEIEVAVVGAHLSGLPLNGELTARGARFLRAVPTMPDYRLHALPGGPPARPGLIRVAPGTGAAIETEVWALAPDAFGRFVAGIPAPLAIGTLFLSDGTTPKGFLAEAAGLTGAHDISGHGGWRAYLASLAAAS